jgi:hypothetical protein
MDLRVLPTFRASLLGVTHLMEASSVTRKLTTAAIGAVFVALGSVEASQALTLVTDRSGLGANDSIRWDTLGPAFTAVSNPFAVGSVSGGVVVKGNTPSGSPEVWNQVAPSDPANFPGWHGNFAPGDALLFTNFNPGPLTLDLIPLFGGTGVLGVGTQIQPNIYGSFRAIISAFDSSGTQLDRFTITGFSSANADNSAIFIGVLSDRPNISRIAFSIDGSGFDINNNPEFVGEFAINQVSLKTGGSISAAGTPVPTPALLPGLIGLGLKILHRRRTESIKQKSED